MYRLEGLDLWENFRIALGIDPLCLALESTNQPLLKETAKNRRPDRCPTGWRIHMEAEHKFLDSETGRPAPLPEHLAR